MSKAAKNKILKFVFEQPRWRVITAVLVIALIAIWIFSGSKAVNHGLMFAAKRGPLDITVLEGGSIEALESQEVRSEVKGGAGTKILKIVEEGYIVTEADVKNSKVLIELDSADIKQRVIQQEIQFQSALASLTEATQGYEIQRNQNISNIKAAEQKAQFARMDVEKFLGDKTSDEIIRFLSLDKLQFAAVQIPSGEEAEQLMLNAMETNETLISEVRENNASEKSNASSEDNSSLTPVALNAQKKEPGIAAVDFSKYAKPELLGDGSAMQQLRKLLDDLQTSRQQQSLSQTKITGTRRLFERGFATKTELDTDEISAQNNDLKVQTAQTAHNLFIKYEFPKQAQELVSKYEESLRGLIREKKESVSKLAQAKARLKGAESRYNIESQQRKDLMDQLDKCLIKAQKPGLVVYGGSAEGYYGSTEQIREGATVRERQPIITIPNMSQMSVKVKVHESYIQKIGKGLKANIQVDAYPNKKLSGEISKVALLPDSQNRWVNPDLKVYQTTVNIDGAHDWLKPGMSAKVEILVKELENVVYVPLQAVAENNGKYFCYVVNGRADLREVQVGEFNDDFIEIKSGLSEGENVLLRAPEGSKSADKPEKQKQQKAPSEPAPAAKTPSSKTAA